MKQVLTCLCLLLALAVSAQTTTLTGVVIDSTGEPLIGASVVEKGQPGNAAVTDFDGNFSIKLVTPTTIVVSYVGYNTQEIV